MASSTLRPIIAALTTTFTPPTGCFTSLEAYLDRDTVLLVPLGITAPPTAFFSCFPQSYSVAGSAGAYYSPGVCPRGFTSACAISSSTLPGESAALCCPSNYDCFTGAGGVYAGFSCSSTIVKTTTITHYTPNTSLPGWQSDGMVTVPANGTTMALGYGIEVRWQSSDLAVFAGATGAGSTAPSTGAGGPTATSTPTPTSSTASTSSSGMSSGTKIALGLGIPIVLILLGLITAALVLIRRRKRAGPQDDKPDPDPEGDTAELQGDNEIEPKAAELPARTPSPVEIDGTRVPSPVFQMLRRPMPVAGDSGYGSSQGSGRVAGGRRVSDTYTISPVEPGGAGPPSTNPSVRRVRRQSELGGPPASPVPTEGRGGHSRTGSGGGAVREGGRRRSGSGGRRASGPYTVSPVSPGGNGSTVSRASSAGRRSSTDSGPPPVPPIPPGHRSRWSRPGSVNRRASDAASSVASGGPVSSPPPSVRRTSTDDRSPPVVRRSVPRNAATPESSTGTSEEERELAERIRMFATLGK